VLSSKLVEQTASAVLSRRTRHTQLVLLLLLALLLRFVCVACCFLCCLPHCTLLLVKCTRWGTETLLTDLIEDVA
jgi:hypothetical protein